MITVKIFFFIGLALFVAYLWYVLKKYGVPKSLSQTYYLLKPDKKSWMFQITLVVLAFLLISPWMELSPDWCRFMGAISCGAIMFVGAAAKYLRMEEKHIHTIAAGLAALASVCWSIFSYKWLWLSPVICGAAGLVVSIFDWKSKTFWFEMAAFLSAFVSLITAMFLV